MAFLSPRTDLVAIAWLALFVAFASASQDIVVDAYRTDVSSREDAGWPARSVSSAIDWRCSRPRARAGPGRRVRVDPRSRVARHYLLMAALMVVGIVAVFWGEEPSTAPARRRPARCSDRASARIFLPAQGGWILVLLVLYKLGDAFAGSLTTAFLLRGAGFSLDDVGYVNKAVGLASTIVGVLFGGALMVRLGLYRALLGFGILQAVSIPLSCGSRSSGRATRSWCSRWASRILPGAWARRRSWRC